LAIQFHPGAEPVLGVRALTDRDQELACLLSARSIDTQRVPLITVLPLVKRAQQADAGLNAYETSSPTGPLRA